MFIVSFLMYTMDDTPTRYQFGENEDNVFAVFADGYNKYDGHNEHNEHNYERPLSTAVDIYS